MEYLPPRSLPHMADMVQFRRREPMAAPLPLPASIVLDHSRRR